MKILENISLSSMTTMRVGGPARFFIAVKDLEELKSAISFAREHKLPFFILGGGSNILVSDRGFSGLVIKMEIKGVESRKLKVKSGEVLVTVGAGEDWDGFVEQCVSKHLYGIENLSYIPGTVGATPIQNVGAYGAEVADTIAWVRVFDTQAMEEKTLSNDECNFGYRDSIFKKEEGTHYIVTHLAFTLQKNGVLNTDYADLKEYFKEKKKNKITLRDVREAVTIIRKNKLPDPKEVGTVGSFFKNPVIAEEHYGELKEKYPKIPGYEVVMSEESRIKNYGVKVPLAWVLDHICRLKGVKEGHVGLYEKQPLALVHFGGGSAEEVLSFGEKIKKIVRKKTGIEIKEEITFIS